MLLPASVTTRPTSACGCGQNFGRPCEELLVTPTYEHCDHRRFAYFPWRSLPSSNILKESLVDHHTRDLEGLRYSWSIRPSSCHKHHHYGAAAEMSDSIRSKTSGNSCVTTGVEPRLKILRRSRRPLLCGVEQARQSALANHVHRIAPMGASILINRTRYHTLFA